MEHRKACPFWFVLILFALTGVHSQTPRPDWAERLDAFVKKGVEDNHIPGLAYGVVEDGRLVHAGGFGYGTLGQPTTAITPDTLFHMASITKPFVATGIMQLVERGKVRLDDPVTKYLPYFTVADPSSRNITIKQMLTHTSGMPDVENYGWDKPQYDDASLERYVRSLKDRKLLWEPGTRFAYSNIAFEVLADVIAKASGTSFEDYMEQNIFKPVGMTSSTLLKEKTDAKRLAAGYTKGKDGLPVPIKAYPYNRPHNASSDLMSSVNDMARWAIVNLNHGEISGKRILQASTYDLMWRPMAEVEFCRGSGPCQKPGGSVGLSWMLQSKDGRFIVSHNGGDDGFITTLFLVPDRKFAFVMMTNTDSAGIPFLKDLTSEALKLVK